MIFHARSGRALARVGASLTRSDPRSAQYLPSAP
jgi:hypothetical protein